MQFLVNIFCFAFTIAHIWAQEMTIPVGESGLDTLTTIRNFDSAGNYDVGYNENQLTGGASFYREKGYINGTREGSYGYTTRNGLIRIVTYVADQNGYRAELLTNEPGVGTANPADVKLTKETEPDPAALAQGPTGTTSTSGGAQLGSVEPQQSSGDPQKILGISQQSLDVPYQSFITPQQNYGNPQVSGLVQQSNNPQQGSGIPQQSSGISQQSLVTPYQSYNAPLPNNINLPQNSQSSVVYASGSNAIKNYVAGPASKASAQVRIVSPYGQYQYSV